MVTVRDLKISLSLRDANFKREMKSINSSSSKFANNLKRSDENLQFLQQTINGFKGGNIPNQINIQVNQKSIKSELVNLVNDFNSLGMSLTFDVSDAYLKKSIQDFIKTLYGGQRIDHIPLKLLESSLKDSINGFITKAGKGAGFAGNQAGILPLPLKVDVPFLVASVNKFLEQALKGKTDIGKSPEKKGKKKKTGDTEPEKTETKKDPITLLIEALGKLNITQNEANKLLEDIKNKPSGGFQIPGLKG